MVDRIDGSGEPDGRTDRWLAEKFDWDECERYGLFPEISECLPG
jgi:hypothetical protein